MRFWKTRPPAGEHPKDPELDHWFHALGPPPVGQASPHLRVKVRARILQAQAQSPGFGWLPRLVTPTWTAVLATGLIVSLAVHVWRGVANGGAHLVSSLPATGSVANGLSTARPLPAYRFQADMQHVQTLGSLVALHAPLQEPTLIVGFTPQATRTTFLRVGLLFAETLATLRGSMMEATASRLDVLVRTLMTMQAPRILTQYLQEMQTLLQSQRYTGAEMAAFLALFEPLYEDAYARSSPDDAVRLFRTGIWLENMYLAAAVKAPGALQQAGQATEDVQRTLSTLQAPHEVLDSLERLRQLVTKTRLTDADIGHIQTLVQTIRATLSE